MKPSYYISTLLIATAHFLAAARIEARAAADVFIVSNTLDGSPTNPPIGSLRWAIKQANAHQGVDNINFSIPGPGIQTITLGGSSFLDELYVTDSVVIDATTQPGYSGSPLIELNCNGRTQGFFLTAANSITIRGFIINRFASNGITIWPDSGANRILDNWIGTDQTGLGSFPSALRPRGIGIQSSHNLIQGNTVCGVDNGITVGFAIEDQHVNDFRCTYNVFANNRIGTDPTGTVRNGNTSDGIFFSQGAAFNTIGPNNVISGQDSAGVELLAPTAQWNLIFGNFIGTDVSGSFAISNGGEGVLISNGARNNCVGGVSGGNVISGNLNAGVVIGTQLAFRRGIGNWVQNNLIGSDRTASYVIPNGDGVVIGTTGSYWNTVEHNLIVGNFRSGLVLQDTISNWISENWVGVRWDGLPMGNARDGILLFGSYWNTVISNDVQFNGFGDPSFTGWAGIRTAGGSANNNIANNYIANNLNN